MVTKSRLITVGLTLAVLWGVNRFVPASQNPFK